MGTYDALDDALGSLRDAAPELGNGFSNHAPMAIEALCTLGRADAVAPWLTRYRSGLIARPAAVALIARDRWQDALGRPERFTDWRDLILNELDEAPWPQIVECWVARLAPGISASATHGVIRTGHAVRALAESSNALRVGELADGLAYWAATYATLPARASSGGPVYDPQAALTRVPVVPAAHRVFAGSITSSFTALDRIPAFPDAINLLDTSKDPAATISQLTATFAEVFLANAHDAMTTIVFIHAVTSATALRSLLPYLSPPTAQAALRCLWQTQCALYATFALVTPQHTVESTPDSPADLIDLAVAHGDEHVIKFTEACLREDRIAPAPAYRAAARHAITILKR
jgi:hypothetical protein